MRAILMAMATILALTGCDGTTLPLTPNQEEGAGGENMICKGDPDRGGVICQPAGEIWDCADLPNGARKCSRPGLLPEGSMGWSCEHDGTQIVCDTNTAAAVEGENGWDCLSNDENTSCVSTGEAAVPTGAGQWRCSIDSEFVITCETDGTGTEETTFPEITGAGASACFCPPDDANKAHPPGKPVATITTQDAVVDGVAALRAQLTFSTSFNDNTYGVNSSPCWGETKKGEHKFKDLVGSDAAEILFTCDGKLVVGAKIDYISEAAAAESGYASLCIDGGDGKLTAGSADDVLGCETSLDANFNTHGYVLTADSPEFNNYEATAPYDAWIYEVWYAVYVRKDALVGSCKVSINYVHASPACGGENSIDVVPCPC